MASENWVAASGLSFFAMKTCGKIQSADNFNVTEIAYKQIKIGTFHSQRPKSP